MASSTEIVSAPAERPAVAAHAGARSAVGYARDLVALTKPRITLLVLLTGAAGMWLAPDEGHRLSSVAVWVSLVGTALIVSAANVLNMWWERDIDGKMARTKNRPLPAGRLSPRVALFFGLALGAVSTPMLFWVNPATGALGLVALVTYAAIYTPLKRRSWLALLVGAVPGAMPPLMGWTTVTGSIAVPGLLLFGVLFLWQVPHFAAITLFRTNDYARAGLMVIAVQRGEVAAKRTIALYTVLLVASSLLLYPFHLAGERYLIIALVSGVAFLALAVRGMVAQIVTAKWAKLVFASSILYLVVLLGSLLLDHPGV